MERQKKETFGILQCPAGPGGYKELSLWGELLST